ncbi:MAG TPA: efflux RND transporter periplasmic adaptor subunit [Cytophagales bacterium]|nr:efflux RND transporter periplasmic adaptor subunit [Cytophagales bacterium]
MKRKLKNNIYLLLSFILVFSLGSCRQEEKKASAHNHEEVEYTCPMHPQILQNEPGTCPICHMDLVKKGGHAHNAEIGEDLNHLLKSTNSSSLSSIRTIAPEEKSMKVTTSANGIITYDTRQAFSIPFRFGGRIEKLFIRYNFQSIQKGQKILEIYSEELATAQRELLYLKENDGGNTELIESAKRKLLLLGASESQIQQLINTGKESYSFAVYSPYNGYVVEESALKVASQASPTSAMASGMGESPSSPVSANASTPIQLREGMYINKGETAFKVINADKVWAEFNLYQQDASNVELQQPVEITFDNGKKETIKATVDFIQPFFKEGESFTKIRIYLSNTGGKYKIGQLVTATFKSETGKTKWIPAEALVDLGTRTVVFVKKENVFQPQVITPGQRSGDSVEVLEGLEGDDQIAHNGQFMIDSESFIRIKN